MKPRCLEPRFIIGMERNPCTFCSKRPRQRRQLSVEEQRARGCAMASAGGGAIRNKRGHSTSKPYERKKSLFRRLTDSFKDVFNPSWLQLRTEKNDASRAIEHDVAASSDEHEDVFVSPVQSPSQLPGQPQFSKTVQVMGDSLEEKQSTPVAKECIASVTNTVSTAGLWQMPCHEPVQENTQTSMAPHFQRDSLSGMFPSSHQEKNSSIWHIGRPVSETRNVNKLTAAPMAGATTPVHKKLPTMESKTTQPHLATLPLTQSRSDPVVCEGSFLRCNESLTVSTGVSISTPSSPSALGGERAAKRQRLWCPESSRRGSSLQPALNETPSFKVSVFCSPSLNDSVHESPFYAGRTTFGGASAYSRRNLNTSVYQTSLPIRKSVKPKPLNTSGNAVLSSSATQILKTLERLSSAKKTGSNVVESDSLLSFTPSAYRKTPRLLSTNLPSRSLELPLRGPPTSKMSLLTSACIAKNRQATTVSSMLTRRAERSVSTSEGDGVEEASERARQTETSEDIFGGLSSDSGSRKMRRTKTYEMHQKIQKDDDVPAEVPALRTDFTLPVGAMPSFNFGSPYSTSASSNILSSSTSTSITAKKTNAMSPPLQFTFSSPIQKSEPGGSPAGATPERFQFSTPLKVAQSLPPSLDKSPVGKQLNFPSSSAGSMPTFGNVNTAPKTKCFSVDAVPKMASATGMFETAASSGFGSFKAASQLKQGSVMDILGASGTSNSSMASASGFGGPIKPASQLSSGSVMDVLRGGKSEASAAASPASSGVKAVPKSKQETVIAEQKKDLGSQPGDGEDLMAKFRPPPGSWECETCCIQNDSKAIKCAACDTAKAGISNLAPGSKSSASSSGPTGNADSLFAKFAPSPGTWECDACMLSNKAEATKCVACETPKPGTPSAAPSSQTDLFAKFRKPADSWECDICSVQNKGSSNQCIACESSRLGTSSPGIKFGNTQPTSSSVGVTIGVSGGITFNFGTSAASTSSPFLTGGSTNKDSASTSSVFTALGNSNQESGISFGAAGTSSSTAKTGFKFGVTSATASTAVPFGTGLKLSSNTSVPPSADKDSTAGIKVSFTDSSNNAGSSTSFAGGFSPAVRAQASNGTQPPPNVNFTFCVSSTESSTAPSGSSAACSLLSPAFSGSAGGSALDSQTTSLSSATAAQGSIEGDKVNFSNSAKKEDSVLASPTTSFKPLFGQPANSFAVGAGQSSAAAESVTSHVGFHFGVPTKTEGAGSSGFGAKTGTQASEHPLPANNRFFDQNKSATTSGFGVQQPADSNNGAASELDQFTAPSAPASDSKEPSGLTFSSIPSGFVLGPSSTSTNTTPSFSFGLPLQVTNSSGLASGVSSQQMPKVDFSGNKPAVNGEAWGTSEGFKFGQPSHSSASGFTFGIPQPKGENPVVQSKPVLGFGFDANAVSKTESSKRGLDKDEGPINKKKVLDFATGPSGAVEPFKQNNANPTTASSTSNVFNFGQSSEDKPSLFGAGFQFNTAARDGSFSFNTSHGNASGSTGPVFGAGLAAGSVGSGNVATGQFAFNAANATLQNSAGAASSISGDKTKSFSFNPVGAPSLFNFGANSSTPSAAVFQFGAAESGTASTLSSPAVFVFGQNSQPGNGQPSFGAGGPQRTIKRAHRRTRK